ncbi:para-aminobenzoate synthetase/4-amino-4-deoxychorismate lyase [Alkalibacillus flavidus]|uniref:Para-aminobenzoate synthetase/4-amino-4-deoxychorismate lyase n=1 Tax=Alkalibacillus flavidus TaxID=546021 RepID=A0ABV2KT18_9BACI
MNKTRMTFHFNHPWLEQSAYVFEDPVDVLQADTIHDVRDVLDRAEAYQKQGYYVAGYVSYEAAEAFYPHLSFHELDDVPYCTFAVFKEAKAPVTANQPDAFVDADFQPDTPKQAYYQRIQAIHDLIARGVTYQVNYTMRLIAELADVDTGQWYEQLRQSQRASFTAHLQFGTYDIISVSPELFFAWDGEKIDTRPMKGTIGRGLTVDHDEALKQQLASSEKDQAENVMIVDLLRNDVTQVAKTGTIRVPELFTVETYPTVHQMTSTVQAETKAGMTLRDIFAALFPCGSITGAPKQRTMAHINELETSARGVYCGAIGMLTPDRQAIFNVPIRTVVWDRDTGRAVYGVGGGVTWDSSADGEYEETVAKARVLHRKAPDFQLLETMRLSDGDIWLEDEHVSRLRASAHYFQIEVSEATVLATLNEVKRESEGLYKLRLLVDQNGAVDIQKTPISESPTTMSAVLADSAIDSHNPFLYHKTTHRDVYTSLAKHDGRAHDTLLWNEYGDVTEFTTGNVAYQLGDEWYTPPVTDGLLPGTYRDTLVATGVLNERSLKRHEIDHINQFAYLNSVRGWVTIDLLH